jgi:UDP-N-acetylmuramate--alanine ligase
MFKRIKHVHFVGIGGIGMSGIAEVLLNLGYKVSGSDMRSTSITEHLARLAAPSITGTHPRTSRRSCCGYLICRESAKSGDCRSAPPQDSGIPRAEMLAELARLKYSIAIAGTHGKTTTTSMIATILEKAGYDPTIVVGGLLNTIGSNARLGKGDYIVLEADESDRFPFAFADDRCRHQYRTGSPRQLQRPRRHSGVVPDVCEQSAVLWRRGSVPR